MPEAIRTDNGAVFYAQRDPESPRFTFTVGRPGSRHGERAGRCDGAGSGAPPAAMVTSGRSARDLEKKFVGHVEKLVRAPTSP